MGGKLSAALLDLRIQVEKREREEETNAKTEPLRRAATTRAANPIDRWIGFEPTYRRGHRLACNSEDSLFLRGSVKCKQFTAVSIGEHFTS